MENVRIVMEISSSQTREQQQMLEGFFGKKTN